MKFTDKAIIKSASFSCSTELMWKRWSTHAGLKSFFGADNRIDLRPGGDFEIYFMMENPYGSRGAEGCKVLAYVPGRSLSFSWNAPPHLPHVRDHSYKTSVTVLIDPEEKGCRVTLAHIGWPEASSDGPNGKQWDETFAYFEKAWDQVMASLAKSLS